jgi:FKBP-type peptidyl-prolyl cis-trans isomerase FklB
MGDRDRGRILKPAVLAATLALAVGACTPATPTNRDDLKPADLESLAQRGVYAAGYELGRNLREQGVEADLDALVRGLIDGLDDRQPLLSDAEMHQTMEEFRAMLERRQQTRLAEQGVRNLAAGAAFLESNRDRPGVVTLPSGLQYEVLREAGGRRPTLADEVTVHFEARLLDGTVWNTSYGLGQPITFRLGEVIPGWREALPLMNEGSRWRIYLPPQLAYGDRSPSPLVGPNATLIFELELLSVAQK